MGVGGIGFTRNQKNPEIQCPSRAMIRTTSASEGIAVNTSVVVTLRRQSKRNLKKYPVVVMKAS